MPDVGRVLAEVQAVRDTLGRAFDALARLEDVITEPEPEPEAEPEPEPEAVEPPADEPADAPA